MYKKFKEVETESKPVEPEQDLINPPVYKPTTTRSFNRQYSIDEPEPTDIFIQPIMIEPTAPSYSVDFEPEPEIVIDMPDLKSDCPDYQHHSIKIENNNAHINSNEISDSNNVNFRYEHNETSTDKDSSPINSTDHNESPTNCNESTTEEPQSHSNEAPSESCDAPTECNDASTECCDASTDCYDSTSGCCND